MTEPFALVRRCYAAVNRRDLEGVLAFYHAEAIGERMLPDDEAGTTSRGREDLREGYARFFDRWDGALDGGALFCPRTIGGIETGWGWVRAEGASALRSRAAGRTPLAFAVSGMGGTIQQAKLHVKHIKPDMR